MERGSWPGASWAPLPASCCYWTCLRGIPAEGFRVPRCPWPLLAALGLGLLGYGSVEAMSTFWMLLGSSLSFGLCLLTWHKHLQCAGGTPCSHSWGSPQPPCGGGTLDLLSGGGASPTPGCLQGPQEIQALSIPRDCLHHRVVPGFQTYHKL